MKRSKVSKKDGSSSSQLVRSKSSVKSIPKEFSEMDTSASEIQEEDSVEVNELAGASKAAQSRIDELNRLTRMMTAIMDHKMIDAVRRHEEFIFRDDQFKWEEYNDAILIKIPIDIDPMQNLLLEALPPTIHLFCDHTAGENIETMGSSSWIRKKVEGDVNQVNEKITEISNKCSKQVELRLSKLKLSAPKHFDTMIDLNSERKDNIQKTQIRHPEIDINGWFKKFCKIATDFDELKLESLFKRKEIDTLAQKSYKGIHSKSKLIYDRRTYWNIKESLKYLAWNIKACLAYFLDFDNNSHYCDVLWIANYIDLLEKIEKNDEKFDIPLLKSMCEILKGVYCVLGEMDERIKFAMLYCARTNAKSIEVRMKDAPVENPRLLGSDQRNMLYFHFTNFPKDSTLDPLMGSELSFGTNQDQCSLTLAITTVDDIEKSDIKVCRMIELSISDYRRFMHDDAERVSSFYEVSTNGKRLKAATIVICCDAIGALHDSSIVNDRRGKKLFLRILRDGSKFEGFKQSSMSNEYSLSSRDVNIVESAENEGEASFNAGSKDEQSQQNERSVPTSYAVQDEQTNEQAPQSPLLSQQQKEEQKEDDEITDDTSDYKLSTIYTGTALNVRQDVIELEECSVEDVPVVCVNLAHSLHISDENIRYYAATVKFVLDRFQCALVATKPLHLMKIRTTEEMIGNSLVATPCTQAWTEDENIRITVPENEEYLASSATKIKYIESINNWTPSGRLSILRDEKEMEAVRKMSISYRQFDFDWVMRADLNWDMIENSGVNKQKVYVHLKNLVAYEQRISPVSSLKCGMLAPNEMVLLSKTIQNSMSSVALCGHGFKIDPIEKLPFVYGIKNDCSQTKLHASNILVKNSKTFDKYSFMVYGLESKVPKVKLRDNEKFPRLPWSDITNKCNLKINKHTISFETDRYYSTIMLFRCNIRKSRYVHLSNKSRYYNDEHYHGLCSNLFYHTAISRSYIIVLYKKDNEENHFCLCIYPVFLDKYVNQFFAGKKFLVIDEPTTFVAPASSSVTIKISSNFRVIQSNTNIEADLRTLKCCLDYQYVSWISMTVEVARMTQKYVRTRTALIRIFLQDNSLYPEDIERLIDCEKKMEQIGARNSQQQSYDKKTIDEQRNSKIPIAFQTRFFAKEEIKNQIIEKLIASYQIEVETFDFRRNKRFPGVFKNNFASLMLSKSLFFEKELDLLDSLAILITKTPRQRTNDPKPVNSEELCQKLGLPEGVFYFFKRSCMKWSQHPTAEFYQLSFSDNSDVLTQLHINRIILRFWFMTSPIMTSEGVWNRLMLGLLHVRRPDGTTHVRNGLLKMMNEHEKTNLEGIRRLPKNDVASSSDDDEYLNETLESYNRAMKQEFYSCFKSSDKNQSKRKNMPITQISQKSRVKRDDRMQLLNLLAAAESFRPDFNKQ